VREFGAASGWGQIRGRLLGNDDGEPMIYCFSTCVDSFRTIPVLQPDPDRLEDLDTTQEDHAADDRQYACNWRPRMKPTPKKPGPISNRCWPTFKEPIDEHDRPGRGRFCEVAATISPVISSDLAPGRSGPMGPR
jgi:hypothetical protein